MSTGDNYLKWKQRAEQAESELRALKLSHERLRKECMEAEARADRAELLAEQRKGGITQLTAQLNESVARAEQAERERDEARRILSEAAPETLEEVVAAAVDCLDDGPRLAMAKHARRMETRAREEKAAREHAEKDRDWARGEADGIRAVLDAERAARERAEAANAALLEQLRTLEAVIQRFRDAEWARGDWLGTCSFRRNKEVLCPGTDGRESGMGTPKPIPHIESCPYHALNTLKEHKP